MTDEDIVEELPDSTSYEPIDSLGGIRLPHQYQEDDPLDWGVPKSIGQAHGKIFERIMDTEAPDDGSTRNVYLVIRAGG
jgi:hypothetical protein